MTMNADERARRVLVCGGRDYQLTPEDYALLASLLLPGATLITGMCRGADSEAESFALGLGVVDVEPYPVPDEEWRRFGRAAGPLRNQRMLDEGKPDLVVAFPGHNGTADMVRRARAAGVPVMEVNR